MIAEEQVLFTHRRKA